MENEVVYIKLPVAVDKPIANLIKKLNKNNLLTNYCCAGHTTQMTIIGFDANGQIEQEEPVDITNMYVSFNETENVNRFFDFLEAYMSTIAAGKRYFGYYTHFSIERKRLTVRIHYNTDNFAENQKRCIELLNKLLNKYLDYVKRS